MSIEDTFDDSVMVSCAIRTILQLLFALFGANYRKRLSAGGGLQYSVLAAGARTHTSAHDDFFIILYPRSLEQEQLSRTRRPCPAHRGGMRLSLSSDITVRLMQTIQGAPANVIVAQYKSNGAAFHRIYNSLWPNSTMGIGITIRTCRRGGQAG